MNELDAVLSRHLLPAARAWQPDATRRAAVLAPLVAVAGVDSLLFVVRADTLRLHPGQIGFPGGADAGDADPIACALRETHEEVGVAPDAVAVLGSLPVLVSSSGFHVHCVVGRVPADARLRLDAREVARTLLVPLRELRDPQRWEERGPPPPVPPGTHRKSPHFAAGADLIWGLTGRFTATLVAALRAPIGR
jgi:8-oxo-dGTP pyrophosphatase MutT (NUDIX family)